MKRAKIYASIVVEVTGATDEELFENFADALEGAADHAEGIADITVVESRTVEIAYKVPPGAERWAATAAVLRFAESRKYAPEYDGSWWLSDGHAALRCEGERAEGYEAIDAARSEATFAAKGDLVSSEWGPRLEPTRSWDRHVGVHRSTANPVIAIQEKFLRLVADAVPDVTWKVAGPIEAVRAYDGDRLIAMVMPMRADDYPLTPPEPPTDTSSGPGPGSNT